MSDRIRFGAGGGAALLAALALASCAKEVGTLAVEIVRSADPAADPFAQAAVVAVRVEAGGETVASTTFRPSAGAGALDGVPAGEPLVVTVEGLGPEQRVISRGRGGPIVAGPGRTDLAVFVGIRGRFSRAPASGAGAAEPRAHHTATALPGGDVLLAGGAASPLRPLPPWSPAGASRRVTLVAGDSLRARVSPAGCGAGAGPGCLLRARAGHTATLLPSGNVLLAGGVAGGASAAAVEVYAPGEARSFAGPPLGAPRYGHAAAPAAGGAVLAGGAPPASPATALRSVERYAGGRITALPGMNHPRRGFTLTALPGGTLVAVGGFDAAGRPRADVEVLAPNAARWRLLRLRLAVPRAHHTTTLLPDGRLLVTGGLTGSGAGALATATLEVLDPTGDRARVLSTPLRLARWAHAATLLPDGRVLLTGGFGGSREGSPTASAEIVDAIGGDLAEVRQAPNMNEVRAGHTATRLRSGAVLVAGGVTVVTRGGRARLAVTAAREVYVP